MIIMLGWIVFGIAQLDFLQRQDELQLNMTVSLSLSDFCLIISEIGPKTSIITMWLLKGDALISFQHDQNYYLPLPLLFV